MAYRKTKINAIVHQATLQMQCCFVIDEVLVFKCIWQSTPHTVQCTDWGHVSVRAWRTENCVRVSVCVFFFSNMHLCRLTQICLPCFRLFFPSLSSVVVSIYKSPQKWMLITFHTFFELTRNKNLNGVNLAVGQSLSIFLNARLCEHAAK